MSRPSRRRWCFVPLLSPRVLVLHPLEISNILQFSKNAFHNLKKKFRCSSSDHCISKCQPTNMTTSSLRLTMSRPSQDSHLEAWVKKLNSWISCDTKILAIYDIYWKIKHWIGLLTPQSLDLSEYECQKIIPHSKIILLAFICFTN